MPINAKTEQAYTVEHPSRNVTVLRVPISAPAERWKFSMLLLSDAHIDHPRCDRRLLKRHLAQARETNAPVFIFGDIFDAMQGKRDKRSNKASLDPEIAAIIRDQSKPYHSALVYWMAEFLEPFASVLHGLGLGNHETVPKDKDEVDYVGDLCRELKARGHDAPHEIGYSGWVRMQFEEQTVRRSWTMKYCHGYGGGGPVTKDMIQSVRNKERLQLADCYASGHTHDRWANEDSIETLSRSNQIEYKPFHMLKLGTYKDDLGDGAEGFAVEKGHPPKPMGGIWMDFSWEDRKVVVRPRYA